MSPYHADTSYKETLCRFSENMEKQQMKNVIHTLSGSEDSFRMLDVKMAEGAESNENLVREDDEREETAPAAERAGGQMPTVHELYLEVLKNFPSIIEFDTVKLKDQLDVYIPMSNVCEDDNDVTWVRNYLKTRIEMEVEITKRGDENKLEKVDQKELYDGYEEDDMFSEEEEDSEGDEESENSSESEEESDEKHYVSTGPEQPVIEALTLHLRQQHDLICDNASYANAHADLEALLQLSDETGKATPMDKPTGGIESKMAWCAAEGERTRERIRSYLNEKMADKEENERKKQEEKAVTTARKAEREKTLETEENHDDVTSSVAAFNVPSQPPHIELEATLKIQEYFRNVVANNQKRQAEQAAKDENEKENILETEENEENDDDDWASDPWDTESLAEREAEQEKLEEAKKAENDKMPVWAERDEDVFKENLLKMQSNRANSVQTIKTLMGQQKDCVSLDELKAVSEKMIIHSHMIRDSTMDLVNANKNAESKLASANAVYPGSAPQPVVNSASTIGGSEEFYLPMHVPMPVPNKHNLQQTDTLNLFVGNWKLAENMNPADVMEKRIRLFGNQLYISSYGPATADQRAILDEWLSSHKVDPKPSKGDCIFLAIKCKMPLVNVQQYLSAARANLLGEKKSESKDNMMTHGEMEWSIDKNLACVMPGGVGLASQGGFVRCELALKGHQLHIIRFDEKKASIVNQAYVRA